MARKVKERVKLASAALREANETGCETMAVDVDRFSFLRMSWKTAYVSLMSLSNVDMDWAYTVDLA